MDFEPRQVKTNKKSSSVIKKVKLGPGSFRNNEERQRVLNLQQQIESKEEELNKVREQLARNDETDISAAQLELNHLQSAFDIVKNKCDAKLLPTVEKYNRARSIYEGILNAVRSFQNSAKERDQSVISMQERVKVLSSELDTPDLVKYDETPVYPLLKNVSDIQTEIDTSELNSQMAALQEKMVNHINTTLAKQLKEAKDRELRAQRRTQTALEESGQMFEQPPPVIDHDWVMAKHKMEKLKIILEDAKRSNDYLKETAEKINAGNKLTQEELDKCKAELKDLAKYFPEAPHVDGPKKGDGVSRGDLTIIEAEKDMSDVLLTVAKAKQKITKSTLEKLKAKLAEMPNVLEKYQQDLEQTKIERENVENALLKATSLKAELTSRRQFAEEEKSLLIERIENQKKELERIEQETENVNKTIERQKTIMMLNEQLANLKNTDFDRLTSTLSNLINIKSRLD
ncbi:hypothetical protein TVAG_016590 [Trichomonas vaginalis G3]|uniref:Uncharacterized protein n=1 Tax=Trichomonas vaginalis (strain ATCC PRA-98 / G3) TaxID=412133 RepID=A2EQZ7_TRIV3|nr:hypothetical protein TVAGG3_0535410 [Trichomonas vaginalis G3]EAY04887.1 hypothetical protein TVAG_016590 [Trichomonas vaginalis G3]KAI5519455.1 hypothetical protein TVAGG3_0535410 [Trichomonas vaginalis G3]|eukprot:XP_001317110.1 hypothetical protein [Trichomonas vaginalis G3]